MGRAEELFFRIKQGGAAEILRMIGQPMTEELFLDYKQSATAGDFRTLDASDRKNLAKAIAGFANSEGGLIVCGVDCRQSPPNGDVPTGARPIKNPIAFKSLLDGATGGVTLPAHSGVESVALSIGGQTEGFVVTHVPIGMNVPCRTIAKDIEDEYYIRAGSSFVRTPHSVLAGLFGRAPHPQLEIILRVNYLHEVRGRTDPSNVPGGRYDLSIDVSIRNSGRGVAGAMSFIAEFKLPPECTAGIASLFNEGAMGGWGAQERWPSQYHSDCERVPFLATWVREHNR